MVTPGILSRVFLFHFEKISGHFGVFWVFRDFSVNTRRNSRFCLKKKKNSQKQNKFALCTPKNLKRKKKNEKKRNGQRYLYNNL